jgi:hypothetical protein
MMDDIVTRLRRLAGAMSEARFPALEATAVEAADEIERLHRDYSCICNEMRRMMEERDEARRRLCLEWTEHGPVRLSKEQIANCYGWDCFKENTDD